MPERVEHRAMVTNIEILKFCNFNYDARVAFDLSIVSQSIWMVTSFCFVVVLSTR